MKKLAIVVAVAGLIVSVSGTAEAAVYWFRFSEEDLWNHTASANTALYDQDAPRRHHTSWKSNVQTTDSAQANVSEYQRQPGKGTNGFPQTATYDTWLSGGPKDVSGNDFGLAEIQLWGAGYPNSRVAWNERYRVNEGAGAWQVLATPTGWTGNVVDNPWDDNGTATLDQFWAVWTADSYGDRILYSKFGDGKEDYIFEFEVDIVGEYATTLEPSPDGNPFEDNGDLRIWFGGVCLDSSNNWTNEGLDGVMELTPIPEASSFIVWCLLAGLGIAVGWRRRRKAA